MMKLKHVLVPVDFSEDSINALAYARDFARPLRAKLTLLYVVEPAYYPTPGELYGPSTSVAMLLDEQRKTGTQQLAKLAADLKRKGVAVRTLLRVGTAYQVITDTAKRERADMIIMGTHGRTGFSRVLIGSVAERVVRGASCPVLTVRMAKKAKR